MNYRLLPVELEDSSSGSSSSFFTEGLKAVTQGAASWLDDFLFHGLPCVRDGDYYFVFSPYARKVAKIAINNLYARETKDLLEQQGFLGDPMRPDRRSRTARFGLILTTGCNLRCKYCYVVPEAKAKAMSPEYARRVITEKVTDGTDRISLSFFGGEPTLNMTALRAAVEHVKTLGIPYQFLMNTNGSASDGDLDYLIENDVILSVSSDGLPAVTDFQRPSTKGWTVSPQVERTIRRLTEAGALYQVRPTVTSLSLLHMVESLRYWADLGVRFLHIEALGESSTSKNQGLSTPPADVYVETMRAVLDEAERLGIWIISSPFMNLLTPSDYFCTTVAGEKDLYAPDGAISTCYRVQERNHEAQHFITGEFDAVSGRFHRFPERIARMQNISVSTSSPCGSCHARYICAGGCPIRNQSVTGDLAGIDQRSCMTKKALVSEAIIRVARSASAGRVSCVFGQSVFETYVANRYQSLAQTTDMSLVPSMLPGCLAPRISDNAHNHLDDTGSIVYVMADLVPLDSHEEFTEKLSRSDSCY